MDRIAISLIALSGLFDNNKALLFKTVEQPVTTGACHPAIFIGLLKRPRCMVNLTVVGTVCPTRDHVMDTIRKGLVNLISIKRAELGFCRDWSSHNLIVGF